MSHVLGRAIAERRRAHPTRDQQTSSPESSGTGCCGSSSLLDKLPVGCIKAPMQRRRVGSIRDAMPVDLHDRSTFRVSALSCERDLPAGRRRPLFHGNRQSAQIRVRQ